MFFHYIRGGSKDDPNNYRPISILPTLSRIFERHVANQLNKYLQNINVLDEHQSGFRQHHLCQTALIRLVISWLTSMDEGNIMGAVFLDFKKAFDLIDHKVLLHRLKMYNFSSNALKLFESYLTNRTQAIRTAVACSNYLPLMSGVPQGSILGPLLFLLYVNDLPLEINSDTDMYVDDTFHCKGKDINEIQLTLQSDINKPQRWCMKNNMAINPTKTTCMIVGSKQK